MYLYHPVFRACIILVHALALVVLAQWLSTPSGKLHVVLAGLLATSHPFAGAWVYAAFSPRGFGLPANATVAISAWFAVTTLSSAIFVLTMAGVTSATVVFAVLLLVAAAAHGIYIWNIRLSHLYQLS